MTAFSAFRIRTAAAILIAMVSSAGCPLYAQSDLPKRSQAPLISRLETNQACEAIFFAADGKTLVTCGDLSKSGNVARFWNLATGKKIAERSCYGNFFAISPDCRRFASISRPGDLRERHPWNLQLLGVTPEGNFNELFNGQFGDWKGGDTWACTAAYSPDNAMVAFADHGETIHIFDATNGREMHSFKGGVAAHYSPDGKELLAVRYSGGLRRIDAESGKPLGGIMRGRSPDFLWVEWAAFSADRRRVAIADRRSILVKDAATGDTLVRIENDAENGSMEFSADHRTLAVRSGMFVRPPENCVQFFDTETGRERGRIYVQAATMGSFAYSADGSLFAWSESSDRDGLGGVVHLCQTSALPLAKKRDKTEKPIAVPIKAELLVGNDEIVIDPKGKSAEEYCDSVFDNSYYSKPKLNWSLKLTNVGSTNITLHLHDDRIEPSFYLTGPAAVNEQGIGQDSGISNRTERVLLPGASTSFPIDSIDHDLISSRWIMPGRYIVHSHAYVDIAPAPAGAKDVYSDGSAFVDIPIAPVEIMVKAKN